MPAKQQFISLLSNLFKGLVLNPSQLAKERNSANLCSNVEKATNGQITVRKGLRNTYYKSATFDQQILFPVTYTYHDVTTGSTVEELCCLYMAMDGSPGYAQKPTKLYRVVEKTLTISYSGTGNGTILIIPELVAGNVNQWRLLVKSNGITDLNTLYRSAASIGGSGDFGLLVAAINALSTFACSPTSLASADGDGPPDVIICGKVDLTLANGDSESFTYYSLTEVGTGLDAPLPFTDANFINPSFQNYGNVLDIAYGTYLQKYDGLDFYRAGLPQATISAIADASGGSTFPTGTTYIYKIVYVRTDIKGNIIEGEDSDDTLSVATHTMSATKNMDVTINNLKASSFPNYALKGAQVNGLQSTVNTITVDSGHTLVVGDNAYFFDTSTSTYVTRAVTAKTSTTITVSGATVSVADNAIISNNVRIQIWRTKASGTDFYLVKEIPNDYANTTQVFTDSVADSALTERFVEQLRKHSLPPKCYFIGEHQGLRIAAGDPGNPNKVYWSLPEDIEAFPAESNNVNINGGGLGAVTGFGTVDDDALAVFKETGHVLLIGSLDDLTFNIQNKASTGIGCTSFRTLQHIGEAESLIGLSFSGPFLFNGRTPQLAVSENIRPLFRQPVAKQVNGTPIPNANWQDEVFQGITNDIPRVLKRAVAFADPLTYKYHLYIPAEAGYPGQQKATDPISSKYLVFNYDPEHLFWTEYTFYNRLREGFASTWAGVGVSAQGGFCSYKNNVWLGMVSYGSFTLNALLFRYNNDNPELDYCDATYPVYLDIHYTPYTRDEGSPTGFFKPLWINIYKFFKSFNYDPVVVPDFENDFTLAVKTVTDYREYSTGAFSTDADKTFDVANGRTGIRVKCVTDKARAYQIQISNENAVPTDFEIPSFDEVELVVCFPYDKQTKDPKN